MQQMRMFRGSGTIVPIWLFLGEPHLRAANQRLRTAEHTASWWRHTCSAGGQQTLLLPGA